MKILYFYDALCGWCYGFAPVISQFYENHRQSCEFETFSGGMIRGTRIGPIGKTAPYIKKAYKTVEEASGVHFGEAFLHDVLEKGEAIFTSVPPALALSVFKSLRPEGSSILFAERLQKGIYFEGILPEDYESYGRMAEEFGLDGGEFVKKMREPEFLEAAEDDFDAAAQLGISGFPTVFARHGDKFYRLAVGFTPLIELEVRFAQLKETLQNA